MPPRTRTPRPDFLKDEPVDTVKPQMPRPLRPGNDGAKAPKQSTPAPPPSPGKYVETVEKLYARASMALMPFAPGTVAILTEELPVKEAEPDGEKEMRLTKCAKAWDNLAAKNASVRRMLEKMSTTSPVVEVIELNAPILMSMAGELGLFSQLGTLVGKLFSKKTSVHEPAEGFYAEYDANGHYVNPEFGRTVA